MKYYNEIDRKLAELLNIDTNFDVIRRVVNKDSKIILYFLSSLANSESINEMNVSLMLMSNKKYIEEQISSGSIELQ